MNEQDIKIPVGWSTYLATVVAVIALIGAVVTAIAAGFEDDSQVRVTLTIIASVATGVSGAVTAFLSKARGEQSSAAILSKVEIPDGS